MLPTNCFIDEKGNIFLTESLKKAATDLPLISYPLDRKSILDEMINWRLDNFNDFINHYQRIEEADIETPIILRSDGYPMDGWHRIIKALMLGKKELPAKRFIIDPEPDERTE